jgi:hypothetical protein
MSAAAADRSAQRAVAEGTIELATLRCPDPAVRVPQLALKFA